MAESRQGFQVPAWQLFSIVISQERKSGACAPNVIGEWFESSTLTLADKQEQKGRDDLSGNAD